MKKLLYSVLFLAVISSCKAVKPYERQYVSDPEMQMENDTGKNFNHYVQSIREGATPVGGTKGSGGCGCN
ncbi:DUF4266 domain-containing protein [Algibacter sp. 2305UL17-15]|uniref:DUF4266 domain-containing protein n=1 Tax=Algibacter sp. 2305UL17-15 TaxID=3231268 RepID=UPI00345A181B